MCDREGSECAQGMVCEPDDEMACWPDAEEVICSEGLTDPAPHDDAGVAVAREEHTAITFDADSDDDVRGWPRRMCIRGSDDARRHGLWYPEATGAARFHELTQRDLSRYERVTGHRRRAPTSTWGVKATIRVIVSEIITTGTNSELRWRSDGPTYQFDVYGLDVHPEWRLPLECTLMRLPIGHLRVTGLKSLCFDIRQPSTEGRFVTDGGATWLLSDEGRQRRVAASRRFVEVPAGLQLVQDPGADAADAAEGRPAIFVTFAALNRPWWRRDRGPAETEDEMDRVYDGRGAEAVCFDTIYHEHGHHFQHHETTPELRRILRRGDLWLRYLRAIPYGGNTRNQGEGFAEAYRRVFNGEGIRGGRFHGDKQLAIEVQAAFDALGMPTQESVSQAWQDILRNKGLA